MEGETGIAAEYDSFTLRRTAGEPPALQKRKSFPYLLTSADMGQQTLHMSIMVDDLSTLKDDMTAFIEGHGMRRFQGYVSDEVQSVLWDGGENVEAWKDFVELAKASNAPFLTTNEMVLQRTDLEYLIGKLERANFTSEDDVEEARWLRTYVGKTGFIQIGFPFQGIMFLYEINCEWYERYQRLMDLADDFGSITIDEPDQDDER